MGGRGSSSTSSKKASKKTPTSVSECSDFQGMQDYMQAQYGTILDDSLGDVELGLLKVSVQGVEDVIKEFPKAQQFLQTIKCEAHGPMTFASYSGGRIRMNSLRYVDQGEKSIESAYARDVLYHGSPAGTTYKDILSHETGHALEWTLDRLSSTSWHEAAQKWNKHTEATRIIGQACKALKRTEYGKGKKNNELVNSVSRYASTKRCEALAECVADYRANGEGANPLSVQVWKILKSELS